MTVDLPHERRCSCDHLAFQHDRADAHPCTQAPCDCRGFAAVLEFDLLD